jgi:hypothetical protein
MSIYQVGPKMLSRLQINPRNVAEIDLLDVDDKSWRNRGSIREPIPDESKPAPVLVWKHLLYHCIFSTLPIWRQSRTGARFTPFGCEHSCVWVCTTLSD